MSRAHLAVHCAVKGGLLPPIRTCSCASCGAPAQHYHHDQGYAPEHWLDVVPLCVGCHRRSHTPTHRLTTHNTIAVSKEMRAQLRQLAGERHTSQASIMRIALAEYADRAEKEAVA